MSKISISQSMGKQSDRLYCIPFNLSRASTILTRGRCMHALFGIFWGVIICAVFNSNMYATILTYGLCIHVLPGIFGLDMSECDRWQSEDLKRHEYSSFPFTSWLPR